MALVTGTDFLIIGSTDVDRSVKFYGETLGLERGKQWGKMPATEFQAGQLTLAVMDPSGFDQPEARPNSAPIALQVDDVPAARARLEARGVTFLVPMLDSGFCHQAIFRDPDGNPLILHHRYQPEAV